MYFSSIKEGGKGNKSWAFWAFFLLVFWTPPLNINLVCFYCFFPFPPFIEKCLYDQIFDILFFSHFRTQLVFPGYLSKFTLYYKV